MTLDANDGIFTLQDGTTQEFGYKNVTYGSPVGEMWTPTREGYTFAGWKDEYGYDVTADTIYLIEGDSTFYAQWEEDTISGQGQFIVKEQTRTVVALKNNDGTPLNNISDLRLTIKSADGSRTFVNDMTMRELSESEIPYVWDKSFAYYTLEDHVKLTGSVVYTLEAEGYTFTYTS